MTFERVEGHPRDEGIYFISKPKWLMMHQVVEDTVSDDDITEIKKLLFREFM